MAMAHEIHQVTEQRPAGGQDRSLGELFADLSRETSTLVRQEVDLAKTELTHKAASVGKDVGFLLTGAAVVYAGFLALVACAIIALAYALPWWLAALIVGIVVAAIGGFLVMRGIDDLKGQDLAPRQTLQSLKEDATWAKDQTS
jgi:uncharacterized membrane protein YqjE